MDQQYPLQALDPSQAFSHAEAAEMGELAGETGDGQQVSNGNEETDELKHKSSVGPSVRTRSRSRDQTATAPPPKRRMITGGLAALPSPGDSPSEPVFETDAGAVGGSKNLGLAALIPAIRALPSGTPTRMVAWEALRRLDRASLAAVQRAVRRALDRDIVQAVPWEIACQILGELDFRTLVHSSAVCHGWRTICAQGGGEFWRRLLARDGLVETRAQFDAEREWLQKARPDLDREKIPELMYRRRVGIAARWRDPQFHPRRITLPGQGPSVITCLQFDDDKIAAGSDDSTITIYDAHTGRLRRVLQGHTGGVWAMKYYGNTLASGSTDRTVRIWNIRQGRCTHIFRGHISTVRCLDIITPKRVGTDDEGKPIIFPPQPLLVTGSRDATLFVWRLPLAGEDDEAPESPVDLDEHSNKYLVRVLRGHTGSVRAVTGYGDVLISGSYDTTARLWDLRTGRCRFVLAGHADRIYSCVYDPERNQCYTGSVDNTVRIWDVATGQCKAVLEGHQMLVGLITCSPHALVSAAADWTVRIWDPDTGRPRHVLRSHSSAITCVQNTDNFVVSGSQGMLKLWDTHTGEFIRDLLTDVDGPVWQVRFDYRRCVAAVQKNRRTCIEILDFCPRGTDNWGEDHK